MITREKKGISRSKIDDLDSSSISWISNFTRIPYPKKIVWKQDDVTRERYYWLKVTKPQKNSLIIASINKQTITIEETTITNIVFRVNDDLVNMDEKVIIKYLEKEIFNGIINRNKKTMSNSIKENGDPKGIYFGEITIDLNIKK